MIPAQHPEFTEAEWNASNDLLEDLFWRYHHSMIIAEFASSEFKAMINKITYALYGIDDHQTEMCIEWTVNGNNGGVVDSIMYMLMIDAVTAVGMGDHTGPELVRNAIWFGQRCMCWHLHLTEEEFEHRYGYRPEAEMPYSKNCPRHSLNITEQAWYHDGFTGELINREVA